MSTFSVTPCNIAARPKKLRKDIDIEKQRMFADAEARALRLRNLEKDAGPQFSRSAHKKMLLALIAEMHRYHRVVTRRRVCSDSLDNINLERLKERKLGGGISFNTLRALVVDIDIVMDSEQDNYAHALLAIAQLSLWQA